jgi:hypothetical protein
MILGAAMPKTKLSVELLYFDGCPSWENALTILNDTLKESGKAFDVSLVLVDSQQAAEEHRFVGSPTIRINGADLFPLEEQSNYGLGCRLYQTPEGLNGWPTERMIKERMGQSGKLSGVN